MQYLDAIKDLLRAARTALNGAVLGPTLVAVAAFCVALPVMGFSSNVLTTPLGPMVLPVGRAMGDPVFAALAFFVICPVPLLMAYRAASLLQASIPDDRLIANSLRFARRRWLHAYASLITPFIVAGVVLLLGFTSGRIAMLPGVLTDVTGVSIIIWLLVPGAIGSAIGGMMPNRTVAIPVGAVVGLLLPFLFVGMGLLLGLLAGAMLAIYLVCAPLTLSAIATDDADPFDAGLSHGVRFVTQAPLSALLLAAVAAIIASIFIRVGAFAGTWTISMAQLCVVPAGQAGLWRDVLGLARELAGPIWNILTLSVVVSFLVCAANVCYVHLRHAVDGVDPAEVVEPPQPPEEPAPTVAKRDVSLPVIS